MLFVHGSIEAFRAKQGETNAHIGDPRGKQVGAQCSLWSTFSVGTLGVAWTGSPVSSRREDYNVGMVDQPSNSAPSGGVAKTCSTARTQLEYNGLSLVAVEIT